MGTVSRTGILSSFSSSLFWWATSSSDKKGEAGAGLCKFLYKLCSCSEHGGRVHQIDEGTCILSDIPLWTEQLSFCVKNNFPGVCIEIRQSQQSLTGFCVVFSLYDSPLASSGLGGWDVWELSASFFLVVCMYFALRGVYQHL